MLKEFLQLEHLRAANSRFGWENTLKQAIRQYQGDAPEKLGWVPFENAPTVQVTTGATQADQILSQAEDLIFSDEPRPDYPIPTATNSMMSQRTFRNSSNGE